MYLINLGAKIRLFFGFSNEKKQTDETHFLSIKSQKCLRIQYIFFNIVLNINLSTCGTTSIKMCSCR